METRLFDYDLPPELVAQHPVSPRDSSRMMVLERDGGRISHARIADLPSYVKGGEVLLLNESKVIPARVNLRKTASGGAVELLFLKPLGGGEWRAMARPSSRLKPGTLLSHSKDPVRPVARLEERMDGGVWRVSSPDGEGIERLISERGKMPLPPYIDRDESDTRDSMDEERYQTVYARVDGSVAAPTAGLHLTGEILERIKKIPAEIARCSLHVGPGTFKPVTVDDVEDHVMDPEDYEMGAEDLGMITRAVDEGRRIMAVGTTSVRVLETVASLAPVEPGPLRGSTALFIVPGYSFRATGALLTNFHMPRSTLLMLVSAFAGTDLARKAYGIALEERYRFLSYGDAMLVL